MDKVSTKAVGKLGEDVAVDFLKNKGYEILARNYIPSWFSQGRKEIDIVARKNGVLVFVEVKTSKTSEGFFPEDKVDFQKQKFLIKAAQSYILEKKISQDVPWQIDVIAITFVGEKPKIEHFENAVSGN